MSFVHVLDSRKLLNDCIMEIASKFMPGDLSEYSYRLIRDAMMIRAKDKVKKMISTADFVHVCSDAWNHAGQDFQGTIVKGVRILDSKVNSEPF